MVATRDPARRLDDGLTTVDVSTSLHGGFLRTGLRISL